MQINIHNVNNISLRPINHIGDFVTRDVVFKSSAGEELVVTCFGQDSNDVSVTALSEQKL